MVYVIKISSFFVKIDLYGVSDKKIAEPTTKIDYLLISLFTSIDR